MIISRTNQFPLPKVCQYSPTSTQLPSNPPVFVVIYTHTCGDGLFNAICFKKSKRLSNSLTGKGSHRNRSIRIHSLATSLLLLSSSLSVAPLGFPQRAKTNNSAKQGSIRPGSSVTLASHLPGRGLTSQAASRALSWTSSA